MIFDKEILAHKERRYLGYAHQDECKIAGDNKTVEATARINDTKLMMVRRTLKWKVSKLFKKELNSAPQSNVARDKNISIMKQEWRI